MMSDDTDTEVGQRIRTIRGERGMTLDDLYVETGLDISLLSRVERGIRSLSKENLRLVARALRVPLARLLG